MKTFPHSVLAFILGAVIGAILPAPALSQTPPPRASPSQAAPVLGPADRRAALDAIKARIRKGYVHMDQRAAIVARLEEGEKSGRYDVDDPIKLAERITADFQAVTHDAHLYMHYEPGWYAAALLPAKPEEAGGENAFEETIARNTNHGLVEMRILEGNIRYLKIDGFDWIENETPIAYDGAMRFLKGGAAIIIDLRGNTGGWGQSSKYLISHFLDGDTLFGTFRFASGVAEQQRALDSLPAGRIKNKPVYILIDHQSRSAAEQVAYNIQQFKVGELIGATTAGASYTTDTTPIPPGFVLSVSISEEIQAISHTGWEVVGVKPDVEVDPTTALEVAQLRAIDRLLPGAEGMQKRQLIWAKPAILASASPVTLTEKELRVYAGAYGAASLILKAGALWLHRPDRDPSKLKPMTRDGLFQAMDNNWMRVRVTGKTLEVLRINPERNQIFSR